MATDLAILAFVLFRVTAETWAVYLDFDPAGPTLAGAAVRRRRCLAPVRHWQD